LDREDPFANFSTNYNTERSEYGLELEYSEREARSIAEEDTGDFSNVSTVTTKSIRPSFSYNLTELDRLITGFGYTERKFDNSGSSTNDLSDNEIIDVSVAWQHSFSERLTGGLSALFMNYEAETDAFTNEFDSYALSATSTYALSELWQLGGELGLRYLDSELTPNIGPSISETSTGETYAFSASRKDELSELQLTATRALLPSSRGEVNEQDAYHVSYTRNLTERLAASIYANYRKFESVDETFATDTEYTELSPNLRWSLAQNLALVFAYKYRSVKRSDSGDADSNAVLVTLDYNWDGIRFSR
jgi:predicted porin